MNQNGTDWNRHGAVGATLLENWVEERAVGEKVMKERNIRQLSKMGHAGILLHDPGCKEQTPEPRGTVSQLAYTYENDGKKSGIGKRRAAIEAELMDMAIQDVKFRASLPRAEEWASTTHKDFRRSFTPAVDLDHPERQFDPDEAARFRHPITYWNSEYRNGEIVASAPLGACRAAADPARARADGEYQHPDPLAGPLGTRPVNFGRHTDFSTPITDYAKTLVKDL